MDEPIVSVTQVAIDQILRILGQEELADQAVRVGITDKSPTHYQYQLEFCELSDKQADDIVIEQGGVVFYVDASSAADLKGASIDYVDTGFSAGFKFENPNKPPLLRDELASRVFEVLKEKINPGVAAHGGHVALLDVKDGTAYVRLEGGCQGCGQADVTVKQGIETAICEALPEIHTVLDVTDHAAGENPYFQG